MSSPKVRTRRAEQESGSLAVWKVCLARNSQTGTARSGRMRCARRKLCRRACLAAAAVSSSGPSRSRRPSSASRPQIVCEMEGRRRDTGSGAAARAGAASGQLTLTLSRGARVDCQLESVGVSWSQLPQQRQPAAAGPRQGRQALRPEPGSSFWSVAASGVFPATFCGPSPSSSSSVSRAMPDGTTATSSKAVPGEHADSRSGRGYQEPVRGHDAGRAALKHSAASHQLAGIGVRLARPAGLAAAAQQSRRRALRHSIAAPPIKLPAAACCHHHHSP